MVSTGCPINTLCGISSRFQLLSPSERQVAHTLLTRPPLSHNFLRRISFHYASFDLHVLGTPPAFILSQDQTLNKSYLNSLSAAQILLKLFIALKEIFIVIPDFKNPFLGAYLLHKLFLHCSIFKVLSASRLIGVSFLIIAKLFEFVKNFFRFARNFFQALF